MHNFSLETKGLAEHRRKLYLNIQHPLERSRGHSSLYLIKAIQYNLNLCSGFLYENKKYLATGNSE